MKYFYGLDLSLTNSGISIFEQSGKYIKVTSIKIDVKKPRGYRLHQIFTKLNNLKNEYPPGIIYIENCFSRFNKSTQALYEVRGITELVFCDVEIVFLAPTSVKKFITGNGKADKKEVLDKIKFKYPDIVFKNLDESDSFAVGLAGRDSEKTVPFLLVK